MGSGSRCQLALPLFPLLRHRLATPVRRMGREAGWMCNKGSRKVAKWVRLH